MANNLADAIPFITARTLEVLRATSVMPRLVNSSFSAEAVQQGDTINIPVTSSMTARAVVPGLVPPSAGLNDVTAAKRTLALNQWYEVPFTMSDKDLKEISAGFQPRVLDEAVATLANKVDSDILGLYKSVYNYVGTAGTTPMGTSAIEAQEAGRVLNSAKAPRDNRYVVVDPFAEANLGGLPVLQRVDQSGSANILRDGVIGGTRAFGFDWYSDQNIVQHNTAATGTYAIDAVGAVGDTSIIVDNGSGAVPTASLIVGDKFTIAGSTQQYTVTSVTAATPASADTYGISPALDQITADGDLLTVVKTDYIPNLAFHRDAIGFASRPLLDVVTEGNLVTVINDPISQLSLRLEVSRQHKQTQFSIDLLYGYTLVRPELACVIFG